MTRGLSYTAGVISGGVGVVLLAVFLTGCCSAPKEAGMSIEQYRAAADTGLSVPPPAAGSEVEQEALARFNEFYAVYSVASITSGVRRLYADDAYFGDPFKSVTGIDAIEAYFVRMAEPAESCVFVVDGVERSAEGSYYMRWTMDLVVKAAPKRPIRALGISHVRFNADGKVVFQQDYWDSSALLEKLPIVGCAVRFVKNRLE